MEERSIFYHIGLTVKAGAGDHICLLSACREFIRRTGNFVSTSYLPDVIAAYNDPKLQYAHKGVYLLVTPNYSHRLKAPGDYVNYYGTYLAALGMLRYGDIPQLDLPKFDSMESYAVIQPFSVFAPNLHLSLIQRLIDIFRETTGKTVYVIGSASTPRTLLNVSYDLLKDDIPHLMRVIQSASHVLTPRSLAAHVAAGYCRPTFMWVPNDGENWHMDYPNWPHVRHDFQGCSFEMEVQLHKFLNLYK